MSYAESPPSWKCPKCTEDNPGHAKACWKCAGKQPTESSRIQDDATKQAEIRIASNSSEDLILTNTPTIEGKQIIQYKSIVAAEAVLGINIFKDIFSSVRDIVGGRSATYEKELQNGRDIAFVEIKRRAKAQQANAVVGITIAYQVLGERNGMLMISVSGTAVVAE